jgi:hypothetical protein
MSVHGIVKACAKRWSGVLKTPSWSVVYVMTACTSFLILLMSDFHVVQDYKKANVSLFKIRNDEMHSIVVFLVLFTNVY